MHIEFVLSFVCLIPSFQPTKKFPKINVSITTLPSRKTTWLAETSTMTEDVYTSYIGFLTGGCPRGGGVPGEPFKLPARKIGEH